MRKIATTIELQLELRKLFDYARSERPSRSRIASALEALSTRLVLASSYTVEKHPNKSEGGGAVEKFKIQLSDQELYGVRRLAPALRKQGVIPEDHAGVQSIKEQSDGSFKVFPKVRSSSEWDHIIITPA